MLNRKRIWRLLVPGILLSLFVFAAGSWVYKVRFKNPDRLTLLQMMIYNDHPKIARALIFLGSDLNAPDKNGYRALNYAIDNYDPSLVKSLLAHGANPNSSSCIGDTPLMHSTAYIYFDQPEQRAIVRLLLASGANPSLAEEDGATALHYAVIRGATDIMALLVDKGAAVDAKDREGHTPLFWLAQQTRDKQTLNKTINWLLDHGARTDIRDNKGRTLSQYASEQNNLQFIRCLERITSQKNVNRGQLPEVIAGKFRGQTTKLLP